MVYVSARSMNVELKNTYGPCDHSTGEYKIARSHRCMNLRSSSTRSPNDGYRSLNIVLNMLLNTLCCVGRCRRSFENEVEGIKYIPCIFQHNVDNESPLHLNMSI